VLEMYLYRIYYGHNAYGLGAASQTYFAKDAKDLTPAQAAFLAGIIQAPVAYDPETHFDLARQRGADDIAPDPAESVHSNLHHGSS